MKYRSKKVFAAAGATLAVAAGAGGALASGTRGAADPAHGPGPVAIASYLGLTPAELRAQLRSGKTLAQIALAQGKTVAGLEDAIYADVQAHLDRAVANGRLSGTQEQAMLAQLKAHVDELVNHTLPARGMPGHKRPAFALAVASYLGLTGTELRTQLRAGKSLAQIATAQGKSVDGLKAAILAAAKSKLDRAVSDNRLTAAQEKTILDRLSAHIDELVNRTRP
jgi:DNA-binding CsgD family transcriptional regulator